MIISKASQKGFFACFLDTMRHIRHCEVFKKECYIHWGQESLYYDNENGENVWEYYFENINTFNNNQIGYLSDYIELFEYDDLDFKQSMNYLINTYVKIKPFVLEIIDNLIKIDENVLGLHIRKTDKNTPHFHGESEIALPLDNEIYFKHIDDNLKYFDKIFLASDDIETINIFIEKYGDKIIYNKDCFRSSGNISIHAHHKDISGFKKGLDVLIDCLCLSRCKYLIKSTSNVSSTAQFFNLNLKSLNLNEIYKGDNRERDYNIYSEKYV
jgi:hypothetical protein